MQQDALSLSIEAAAQALAKAKRVVLFTGAGMSAESGINTFRDPEVGVWKNKIALAMFGTPFGWRWTPGWAWSNYRRFHGPIFRAQPNAGHYAAAHMAEELDLKERDAVQIITQNVDYLHQRAGTPDEYVYEIHGSVFKHRCIKNGHAMDNISRDEPLPEKQVYCATCSSAARPDAVLFTESLPERAWSAAAVALQSLEKGDVMFIVGTSGSVQPAASLPQYAKLSVVKIVLNTNPTEHSAHANVFVEGPSGESLQRIVERAKSIKFNA